MARISRRKGKTMIKLKENESALIFTPDNMHMLYANHVGKLIQALQTSATEEEFVEAVKENDNLYDHLAARMYFEVQMHMSELSGDSPDVKHQWVQHLEHNDDSSQN
jgi:hypothetical protein